MSEPEGREGADSWTNHAVSGGAVSARALGATPLRLAGDVIASSTSSRIVTAVTSGPAPGPENVSRLPLTSIRQKALVAFAVAARGWRSGTNAGPTNARIACHRPARARMLPQRVSPRRQVLERAQYRVALMCSIPAVSMSSTSTRRPANCRIRIDSFSAASMPLNVIRWIWLCETASLRLGQSIGVVAAGVSHRRQDEVRRAVDDADER